MLKSSKKDKKWFYFKLWVIAIYKWINKWYLVLEITFYVWKIIILNNIINKDFRYEVRWFVN